MQKYWKYRGQWLLWWKCVVFLLWVAAVHQSLFLLSPIALVAGCKQSRVPAVQQSNIVLGMKRATACIKSGQGATCHSCGINIFQFLSQSIFLLVAIRGCTINISGWQSIQPLPWNGVEKLLSGFSVLANRPCVSSDICFLFSLNWNISMGICIWRCSDHKERYLLWKYRSKVEGSWRVKVPCEQELQIYETLPNTVYGTRHGMCVLVAKVFKIFFALI